MKSDTSILQICGLTKKYGRITAIDQINLEIKAGEFVTFLGPSGCGKSTTLRILGGFEKADQGRIILEDRDVTALPPNKRNVNMVFQDYALFPHMTVRKNVSFGLELKGLTKLQITRRLDELLTFLELEAFADRHPEQLSGGQRQRVALARALAPEPSLLLLDEPLGALDAKLRTQVQVELKSIQRRTNKTFIFVTHDQDEALTMSDRIVVMNKGRIEQDGTPEELYSRPESRFVADFIGETNFLTGRICGTEGNEVVMDWFGHKIRGCTPRGAPPIGQTATVSLRLESVELSKSRPEHGNAVSGRIVNRVFRGNHMLVDLAVDGCSDLLRAHVRAEEGKLNDEIWIGWLPQKMIVLVD